VAAQRDAVVIAEIDHRVVAAIGGLKQLRLPGLGLL
jgi:hypothetical protein